MNRKLDNILFVLGLILIAVFVVGITSAFSANVSDDNKGKEGYILINNGIGQGHQGTWTNIKEVPELKGEKGDKGLQGIQGIQGIAGTDGIDGLNGIDGYTPVKGIDYFDGLNGIDGKDGKDFDPIEVNRLDNRIDISNISVVNETSDRKKVDTQLQNNINSVNSRVDDVSNRVSALERTQYVIKTELKFIREKHFEMGVYGAYNVGRNVCSEVGLNIIIPIGESYLDRENKKINTRLERLEQTLGQNTVITKVVDNKGKIKSIQIQNGGILMKGEF